MSIQGSPSVRLLDFAPCTDTFAAEVQRGLSQSPKQIPCKFLYDRRGSALYDSICQTREYYPARTELAILREYADEMAGWIGPRCRLVEFGSGSSSKTRLLLDALMEPAGYVPVDISRAHLLRAARRLATEYPGLEVLPVCADYTTQFSLPQGDAPYDRTVLFFPGSTIGNFEPGEACCFLDRARYLCGPGCGLLIGVDLKKDRRVLHAAYNDKTGVTAEFNLNLLTRMNRELGANFISGQFFHRALYNESLGRIEMHLVSRQAQVVRVAGKAFEFARGESIFTESSYKYDLDEFASCAQQAGYQHELTWTDRRSWFSVQYFRAPQSTW